MSSISKISVKLNLQGQVYDVGSLVLDDTKRIYFKYNGNFSLLWHNSHFKTEKDKKMFAVVKNEEGGFNIICYVL